MNRRRSSRPGPTVAAIAAAALAAAVTALYAFLIANQGDADRLRPRLIAASLLIAAAGLVASTLVSVTTIRVLLSSLGAFTQLIWTVLGALSIGVLLLPSTLLALFATTEAAQVIPTVRAWTVAIIGAAAALLAVTVLLSVS